MSSQGTNITKYMLGNVATTPTKTTGFFGTKPNIFKTNNFKTNTTAEVTTSSSWGRIVGYLLAIIGVILVILLFVNFFITPIFKTRPGGPGVIPVPGFDDGKLFWNKVSAGQILNKDLPISSMTFGYTMILDVFVENPLQFSKYPRVFFSRGAVRNQTPTTDTLLGVLSNYNIACALLPDTNDMLVSVLNKDNNMENVIVPNVPVQEPFRVGMVVMERALEVYVNGYLIKTKTFTAPPIDNKGDIYPAIGVEANIVKVRNLKIWKRLLTSSEIRESKPTLSSTSDFGGTQMGSSTTCTTGIGGALGPGIDRIVRLSADTVPDPYSSLI